MKTYKDTNKLSANASQELRNKIADALESAAAMVRSNHIVGVHFHWDACNGSDVTVKMEIKL